MQLWSVFIASLLGSAHCAAMCGGLASFCSGFCAKKFNYNYHLGRLSSYLILGATAGMLGASVDRFYKFEHSQSIVSLITGGFLILWGLLYLVGKVERVKKMLGANIISSKLSNTFKKLIESFVGNDPKQWSKRSYLVGFFSAFMPCGWLYAFVLVSASTGSVLTAMLTMFVFWLGTVPALIFVGEVSKGFSNRVRKYSPCLVAIVLILAGLSSVGVRQPLAKLMGKKAEMSCH